MTKSELPFLSAGDLSRLIQSKEVSPVEATEAYLDASRPWTTASTAI
jgi:Asp-tRNA(Asn)/Glu-tRNA(Gln) amidotransferase A subunit family amidase